MKNAIRKMIERFCENIENQKRIDEKAVVFNSAFINYSFSR